MNDPPTYPSRSDALLGRKWAFLAFLTAASLVAAVVSSQTYLEMRDHGHEWWRLFLWQLGSWWFWALLAPWVLNSGKKLLRSTTRPRLWPLREGLKALLLLLLHFPLAATVFFLLQPFDPVETYTYAKSLQHAYWIWSRVDPFIFAMLIVAGYGIAAYRQARSAELRALRLKTALAEAKLEALRLQIQPHFLFNTLHSIAALVRQGSDEKALEMILGLSELLRAALEESPGHRVSLERELDLVDKYLELQKARFGDRLSVRWDIAEDCKEFPVPVFLLQPLVENAILHGLSKRRQPGHLTLTARLNEEALRFTVEDNGQGLPPHFSIDESSGVGLKNIRSRLVQLYCGDQPPESPFLRLRPREGGGTIAEISLPLEVASPDLGGPTQ